MPAKVTEKVFLPGVEAEFRKLFGRKIIVGPVAAEGSELAKYAAATSSARPSLRRTRRTWRSRSPGKPKTAAPGILTWCPCSPGEEPVLGDEAGKFVEAILPVAEEGHHSRTLIPPIRVRQEGYRRQGHGNGARNASTAVGRIGDRRGCAERNRLFAGLERQEQHRLEHRAGNAPLTLALKRGKSTTLVDEGQLLKSISYEVM